MGNRTRAPRPRRSLGALEHCRLGMLCSVGGGRRVRVEVRWTLARTGVAERVVGRTAQTLTATQARRLRVAVRRRLVTNGWTVLGEVMHQPNAISLGKERVHG